MRLLTVLFNVLIMFLVMVAVVAGISYLAGRYLYSLETVSPSPGDTDPCAQCNADRAWFETLPVWKKTVILAWWLVNRYLWAKKGCK